jgi:hypothetical protein
MGDCVWIVQKDFYGLVVSENLNCVEVVMLRSSISITVFRRNCFVFRHVVSWLEAIRRTHTSSRVQGDLSSMTRHDYPVSIPPRYPF